MRENKEWREKRSHTKVVNSWKSCWNWCVKAVAQSELVVADVHLVRIGSVSSVAKRQTAKPLQCSRKPKIYLTSAGWRLPPSLAVKKSTPRCSTLGMHSFWDLKNKIWLGNILTHTVVKLFAVLQNILAQNIVTPTTYRISVSVSFDTNTKKNNLFHL